MIDQRDFVLSPEIAHSPEKLAEFLTAEMGEEFLETTKYRIEKISRWRQDLDNRYLC